MESWAETKCGSCKETLRPLRIQLHILSQPEKDGNKWDENKRGPWKTSETRLIRVLEDLCKFGGKADATCAALVEKNEEAIEEWFYAGADPATWIDEICVKAAGHCCSSDDQHGPCYMDLIAKSVQEDKMVWFVLGTASATEAAIARLSASANATESTTRLTTRAKLAPSVHLMIRPSEPFLTFYQMRKS